MKVRLRPLILAESCNPEWVSVPLEGWSHSKALLDATDGHLVTQIRNREALIRAGLVEGKDFTAIDSEKVAARVHRLAQMVRGGKGKGWTTNTAMQAFAYPYFEKLVWRQFRDRLIAKEFDLVHRVTPLSPTMSSLLARRCRKIGVPFMLGPLNGGVPWPKGFDKARRQEKEWLSYVRNAYKLLPGFRSTRKNASAIVIGSRDTWQQMPGKYHAKCVYIPENAIDPARFTMRRTRRAELPIRAMFLGRLVPYKGADMLIEAAAELCKSGAIRIDIIGEGPERSKLQGLIERFGLQDSVTLHGNVPHTLVQNHLVNSDILSFPSVREFGGGVVVEAMAVGVVPVVCEYGGPAELVSPGTGVAVPIGSREEIIERFRAVLGELCQHPERIDAMSARAVERAHKQFTWPAKAQQSIAVYRWITGATGKPDFGMPLPEEFSQ